MTFDEYEAQLLADGFSLPGPAEKCRAVWDWCEKLAADKSIVQIDLNPESEFYGWVMEEKSGGSFPGSGPSRRATVSIHAHQ